MEKQNREQQTDPAIRDLYPTLTEADLMTSPRSDNQPLAVRRLMYAEIPDEELRIEFFHLFDVLRLYEDVLRLPLRKHPGGLRCKHKGDTRQQVGNPHKSHPWKTKGSAPARSSG